MLLSFNIPGNNVFPSFKVVEEDDYYETSSLLGRIAYMTPVFFNFRMRLYTGFVLSGATTWGQIHQHFMSCFCAKNYKARHFRKCRISSISYDIGNWKFRISVQDFYNTVCDVIFAQTRFFPSPFKKIVHIKFKFELYIQHSTPGDLHFSFKRNVDFSMISECSCIMAGIGAYPSRCNPQPGHGPTDLKILEEM